MIEHTPWTTWFSYRHLLIGLFLLHCLASVVYLNRVPGLLGDEASEGENVFTIIDTKELTAVGERSYIGPLIDYIRVPFVLLFGHSAFTLRLVTLLASLFMFLLLAWLLPKYVGNEASLFILVGIFFSPIYLLYQRLGWAITLIPLGVVVILASMHWSQRDKSLWKGFLAGLALSNHFIFLASLSALVTGGIVLSLATVEKLSVKLKSWLIAIIGFMAGFGPQLSVMLLKTDDQGDPTQVAGSFIDRLQTLPTILPGILSGSLYSALYTGEPYPQVVIYTITLVLVLLVALTLFFSPQKKMVAIVLIALIVHLTVLLLIIDRFAVRYLVVFSLTVWGLAGYGFYTVLTRVGLSSRMLQIAAIIISLALTGGTSVVTLIPYLSTGGSTQAVNLTPSRSEPAAAHVDVRPLLACLEGQGPVFSENVHILNRLQYLSHDLPEISVAPTAEEAVWLVAYNDPAPASDDSPQLCQLTHFRVWQQQ